MKIDLDDIKSENMVALEDLNPRASRGGGWSQINLNGALSCVFYCGDTWRINF